MVAMDEYLKPQFLGPRSGNEVKFLSKGLLEIIYISSMRALVGVYLPDQALTRHLESGPTTTVLFQSRMSWTLDESMVLTLFF